MKEKNVDLNVNITIQQLDGITGKIKREEKVHNTVTSTGDDRAVKLISGLSSATFTHVAIGTGSVAPAISDIALGVEVIREPQVAVSTGTGIAQYDHTFTVGSGVSHTIQETGLFDQLAQGGSTMLNRGTFAPFSLDTNNPLRIIITLTVT